MWNLLSPILGDYTYQCVIQITSFLEFLMPVLLFAFPLKRRKHFLLRFLSGIIVSFGLYFLIAVLRTDYNTMASRVLVSLIKYAAMLPLLVLCLDEGPSAILLCWCAGIATQEISAKAFSLLLYFVGSNDQQTMSLFPFLPYDEYRDWAVYYVVHFLIDWLLFQCFRRTERLEEDRQTLHSITILSVFSMISLSILSSFTREYQSESMTLYTVCQVFALLFAFFVLFMRTGILSQNRYRQEISLMEQVLYEERKQYQSIKENIDIINMKCHDLKHQLAGLSGKLTDQEIQTLQEAIRIYDSNIKTGNEVLDVILYEKQLVCQKEGIRLSCLANGELLSFMRTTHIYALFNNAISNALEAVRKIENPEKRVIDITVAQEGAAVEINVINYFEGTRQIVNGLPATTKDDRNHHGFGIMSMKYITEQYHGTISTTAENEIFTLQIHIPLSADGIK